LPRGGDRGFKITGQARITARQRQRPLLQFALSSAALLVLVAAIGAVALRHLA